jgi:hypothetical protein
MAVLSAQTWLFIALQRGGGHPVGVRETRRPCGRRLRIGREGAGLTGRELLRPTLHEKALQSFKISAGQTEHHGEWEGRRFGWLSGVGLQAKRRTEQHRPLSPLTVGA